MKQFENEMCAVRKDNTLTIFNSREEWLKYAKSGFSIAFANVKDMVEDVRTHSIFVEFYESMMALYKDFEFDQIEEVHQIVEHTKELLDKVSANSSGGDSE